MEAAPRLRLLGFAFKTSTDPAYFTQKLKQYITEVYHEDGESYRNELHILEGLRAAAVHPTPDAAGLATLLRYFCQLRALQSRFPMGKGQPAAVDFTWKDIFNNTVTKSSDIKYEMGSVLYNIGAAYTQLGANENRSTPDGLKSACTQFQTAAWVFGHLNSHYTQPSGLDISQPVVRVLQELCLAQAQECILEKSLGDARKPTTIGAVASQVLTYYRNAANHITQQHATVSAIELMGSKHGQNFQRYIQFKTAYVGCIMYLYHGMQAEDKQKMGERVAFYQLAVDKLDEAKKLMKYIEPKETVQEAITFTNDVVEGKRKAAKNENEFIYHEEVPEKELLVEMKPAVVVKETPIDFNDPNVSGADLFSRLVPMGAHEASSLYSEEKAKLVRRIVSAVETKDQALSEFMSSLQLDLLDATDADESIPQEVVDRCAAMNADSSIIQTLVESMNNLAEIISDVEAALAETKEMIEDEMNEEKEYQTLMGSRPPSLVQTELSRELNKYAEAHARTGDSNRVLHKAMTLHLANLRLLASPLEVLGAKIPTINKIEGLDKETLAEMRKVTGAVRDMQTQRAALTQQLRDAVGADDVTARLLARGGDSTDEIFCTELKKHDAKVKLIELNLAAQENIINRLTSVYASYGESRRLLADVIRKREAIINALVTSFDTRSELLGKAQKGLEFYRKLSSNVNQLLVRLKSTCQVQREERATMLSKQSAKGKSALSTVGSVEPQVASPSESNTPKLKDYLPYMKNRAARGSSRGQEKLSSDQMYPEYMFPTSARPTPVGSEANTDPTQIYTDGYAGPDPSAQHNVYTPPYNYGETSYSTQSVMSYQHYANNQPSTSADYHQPGTYTPQSADFTYTPSQYPSQSASVPQNYYSPYYTGSRDANTTVTSSENSQYGLDTPVNPGMYQMTQEGHSHQGYGPQHYPVTGTPTSVSAYGIPVPSAVSQAELNSNFSQLQISGNASTYPSEVSYSQTYFSAYYLQNTAANVATYSNAAKPLSTSMSPSPMDYSLNYPYTGSDATVTPAYQSSGQDMASYGNTIPSVQYSNYMQNPSNPSDASNVSQSMYTTPEQYSQPMLSGADSGFSEEKIISSAALSTLPLVDQPIKSHVTGQAMAADNTLMQQMYQQNYPTAVDLSNVSYSHEQSLQSNSNYQNSFQEQQPEINTNIYPQSFQGHPGYYYNPNTCTYEYTYGYQSSNSYNVSQSNDNVSQDAANIYTNAGAHDTIQSPSINTEQPSFPTTDGSDHNYYASPYGYQSNASANNGSVTISEQPGTNYGADVNQPTYMSSGQAQQSVSTYSAQDRPQTTSSPDNTDCAVKTEIKTESPEQSTMDLLSGLDFTVDQKPLMPEIKVPPISEHMIRKQVVQSTVEQIVKKEAIKKEEQIERPAKKDLFSDPSLLNKFTQEVKQLQKFVDSLTNKMQNGITVLDNKWKSLHEAQAKENAGRSKSAAMEHTGSNVVSEVVPFNDSRLTLQVNPEVYINASEYTQLASWCIPLVISDLPEEKEHSTFWTAVMEKKVACVVCLLSEMELQGKCYWPTGIGQSVDLDNDLKVTLDEVTSTVHWTERRLTLAKKRVTHTLSHYQITVFPTKVVSGPLVLLADRVLSATYSGRLSNQLGAAWAHCERGAGRSALLALLLLVLCQVRAGQVALCDMIDAGCLSLYKGRTNVLEDTKYLADAYRTALFYVQGVLCSGTTAFNGEAISSSGAASLPPPAAPAAAPRDKMAARFSKESFEEMRQAAGLKTGDMTDPLSFLDPLWSLKKK